MGNILFTKYEFRIVLLLCNKGSIPTICFEHEPCTTWPLNAGMFHIAAKALRELNALYCTYKQKSSSRCSKSSFV